MATLQQAHSMLMKWIASDTVDEVPAVISDASETWVRSCCTRLEVLVLRSMRDSRKKKDNLRKYTAQFVSETECDWKEHMFPPLAKEVSLIIK